MPWRELPHTADLRLEITAADWPALLMEAAAALTALLGGAQPGATGETLRWHISGHDREELLVHWLNELLFRHESQGTVTTDVQVQRACDSEAAGTFEAAPAKQTAAHIKAATYHDLRVETVADGLRVVVVLDT